MRFKVIFLLVVTLPLFSNVWAQSHSVFKAYKDDELLATLLLKETTERYEADKKLIKGEYKKYKETFLKNRYEDIKRKYERKEIITDGEIYRYLNRIKERIVTNNPQLRGLESRVLFSKTFVPNACSFGEGTILFNAGLFNRLGNESQVAFVLCHEFSHLYLQHSEKRFERILNETFSKDFQKKLKDLKNTEYGQREEYEKLVKVFEFGYSRYSRETESQADSMAVVFLHNTDFDIKEALPALALLDSVDADKYTPFSIEQTFNFSNYPFQKKWIKKEAAFFGVTGREKVEFEDSLKSHPDCPFRIKSLEPLVKSQFNKHSSASPVDLIMFQKLRDEFDFEIIDYCYQDSDVARCLYYSLELMNIEKDNVYLKTMVGHCLNKMYMAQKSHQLTKLVQLPSPSQEKHYNAFLEFIQRIRLEDIAAFNYYFLQPDPALNNNEEYLAAIIYSRQNFGKQDEAKQYISFYQKNSFSKYKFN